MHKPLYGVCFLLLFSLVCFLSYTFFFNVFQTKEILFKNAYCQTYKYLDKKINKPRWSGLYLGSPFYCLSLLGSMLEMGKLTSSTGQELMVLTLLPLSPSMLFINHGYLLCPVPCGGAFFSHTFCTFIQIWL